MGFSFEFRIALGFVFILLVLFLGTLSLYLGKDTQTQYIANRYNTMIDRLLDECKIDLNELQKKDIKKARCQTMENLYESKAITYQQLLDSNC